MHCLLKTPSKLFFSRQHRFQSHPLNPQPSLGALCFGDSGSPPRKLRFTFQAGGASEPRAVPTAKGGRLETQKMMTRRQENPLKRGRRLSSTSPCRNLVGHLRNRRNGAWHQAGRSCRILVRNGWALATFFLSVFQNSGFTILICLVLYQFLVPTILKFL